MEILYMRVADFFCGAGGFSEGFRQAGFYICFAVDRWEPAVNTYRANKPECNVIQDDIIRISKLPDNEFDLLIPDTEVIIGSPPCVAFSSSNKSGKGDKKKGLELLKAYLRIIARKKFKPNSQLRYWVLENVPNIRNYMKNDYHADDLDLQGDFTLSVINNTSEIYNAKYFGAPTNRKRFICGEFPALISTHTDETVITLRTVLDSLGLPLSNSNEPIQDCNYPDLIMPREEVTDHHYICTLEPFEWETAKRLKEDKGYMGHMSFPENLDKPSRTVMATMSSSSRESMILQLEDGRYRLPTVREAASMMSFPIDYQFYGQSKGVKHTLVGNAVPPKLSFAIAQSIANDAGEAIPNHYIPIQHNPNIPFFNLNGSIFPAREEKEKRLESKFKYHIPYLIINAYRVELTNYNSDFDAKSFIWNVEIHYSQGKDKAKMYLPKISQSIWDKELRNKVDGFLASKEGYLCTSFNDFQKIYCLTSSDRLSQHYYGPYELLDSVRSFIDNNLQKEDMEQQLRVSKEFPEFPKAIVLGYYIINRMLKLLKHKKKGH